MTMTLTAEPRVERLLDTLAADTFAFDRNGLTMADLFSRLYARGEVQRSFFPGGSPVAQLTGWAANQLAPAGVTVECRDHASNDGRGIAMTLTVTAPGRGGAPSISRSHDVSGVRDTETLTDTELRLPDRIGRRYGVREHWMTFLSDLAGILDALSAPAEEDPQQTVTLAAVEAALRSRLEGPDVPGACVIVNIGGFMRELRELA